MKEWESDAGTLRRPYKRGRDPADFLKIPPPDEVPPWYKFVIIEGQNMCPFKGSTISLEQCSMIQKESAPECERKRCRLFGKAQDLAEHVIEAKKPSMAPKIGKPTKIKKRIITE